MLMPVVFTSSLSCNNCTEEKQSIGAFFDSNVLAMALIANTLGT